MKRDYEKEARALLEKFRPLISWYINFFEFKFPAKEKGVSPARMKRFINVARQLRDLDPLKIMFYGDSIPFRDTSLPENTRKENRAKREEKLIRKIVSALKSGKMSPLKK